MEKNYEESCKKAEIVGYEKVVDIKGFNGFYYIKDEKIWIHDLNALAEKMEFTTIQECIDAGYNVEDYEKFADLSVKEALRLAAREEMQELYDVLKVSNDPDGRVYLSDGVWLNADGELDDGF